MRFDRAPRYSSVRRPSVIVVAVQKIETLRPVVVVVPLVMPSNSILLTDIPFAQCTLLKNKKSTVLDRSKERIENAAGLGAL